jgi:hypothetical protein
VPLVVGRQVELHEDVGHVLLDRAVVCAGKPVTTLPSPPAQRR